MASSLKSAATGKAASLATVGRMRWSMSVILGVGILINYIDRLSVAVVMTPMSQAFNMSATEFGIISSAFLWSYAIMQVPGGMILDRIGVKWVWRIGMGVWAVSSFLTAVATGIWVVILARILLGAAEAPAFPGAMKATGSWFPRSERGFATAIFDGGTRLANVIGLPLIAWVVAVWGWREAFVAQGALSIIYLAVFWWHYRSPKEKHNEGKLSNREYQYIVDGGGTLEESKAINLQNLGYLLRQRKVWGLSLGLAGVGYTLWMLLTWLPGYLQMAYDQSVLDSALYTAIPALAMFISELTIGGLLIDWLIKKGRSEDKVRKGVLILGVVVSFLTVGAALSHSANAAIIWIAAGSAGIALVYVVSNSLPAIIAPQGDTGAVAAIMNCVNLLAGVAAPIVTGAVVEATGDFRMAFVIGGIILVGGLLSYLLLMGKIEPIQSQEEAEKHS